MPTKHLNSLVSAYQTRQKRHWFDISFDRTITKAREELSKRQIDELKIDLLKMKSPPSSPEFITSPN